MRFKQPDWQRPLEKVVLLTNRHWCSLFLVWRQTDPPKDVWILVMWLSQLCVYLVSKDITVQWTESCNEYLWLSYAEQEYNCSNPHSNPVSDTNMLWLIHKRTCLLLSNHLCENVSESAWRIGRGRCAGDVQQSFVSVNTITHIRRHHSGVDII